MWQTKFGEWWLTHDDQLINAEGANGHSCHNDIAVRHAMSLLFGCIGNDPVADALLRPFVRSPYRKTADPSGLRMELLNHSDYLSRCGDRFAELYDDYTPCLLRAGVSQALLDALFGHADPREWVVLECDWMSIVPQAICLRTLDDKHVRRASTAWFDIWLQRKIEPVDYDKTFVNINVRDRAVDSAPYSAYNFYTSLSQLIERRACAIYGSRISSELRFEGASCVEV